VPEYVDPAWLEEQEGNSLARGSDIDEDIFVKVLGDALDAIESADIPHVLMGGIASAVWGRPRWTHDIDIFVAPAHARHALEALSKSGFDTEETYAEWLFKAFRDGVLVDIVFRSTGEIYLDEEMVERSVRADFKGREVPVMSAEDLLVIKAVVHAEHMPRHWHDALGLIGHCDLDWDYVVKRARQHGARRVLSVLLYAQSNDLIVPNRSIESLYEAIFSD
jgi:predicted nucleotidyltransferase